MDNSAFLAMLKQALGGNSNRNAGPPTKTHGDVTVRVYNGDGDTMRWFEEYSTSADLAGWEEARKISGIPFFLAGAAKTAYESGKRRMMRSGYVDGEDFRTMEGIRKWMARQFKCAGLVDTQEAKIESIHQREGESVTNFYWRYNGLLLAIADACEAEGKNDYINGNERLTKGNFLRGLSSGAMRTHVKLKNPTTLTEARDMAIEYERVCDSDGSGTAVCSSLHKERDPTRVVEQKTSTYRKEWDARYMEDLQEVRKEIATLRKQQGKGTKRKQRNTLDSESEEEEEEPIKRRRSERLADGADGAAAAVSDSKLEKLSRMVEDQKESTANVLALLQGVQVIPPAMRGIHPDRQARFQDPYGTNNSQAQSSNWGNGFSNLRQGSVHHP
jgi:hypothetical protein